MQLTKDNYSIDTEKTKLQFDVIYSYLADESYWAANRTEAQMRAAIEHSMCFGLYAGEEQIGFARVVTDHSTFAYLGDVFVLTRFQGKGLGEWLMEAIIEHPDLQGLRRWVLATRDAHGLYKKFGFHEFKHPERWMELPASDAY